MNDILASLHPLKTCRFCIQAEPETGSCKLHQKSVSAFSGCEEWRQEFETGDICIHKGILHDCVVIVTWASRDKIAYRYLDAPNGVGYGVLDRTLPDDHNKPTLINTLQKYPMPTLCLDLDMIDKQREIYVPEKKTKIVKEKDPLGSLGADKLAAFNCLLDAVLKGMGEPKDGTNV